MVAAVVGPVAAVVGLAAAAAGKWSLLQESSRYCRKEATGAGLVAAGAGK